MLRLNCVAQQYDWGKTGGASAVAQLKSKGEGVPIDEAAPYAEYWFGTHPSGPSRVAQPGGADVPLQDWLLAHPAALGAPPYSATSALPYLFKVLSVAKALSVQAHPDKRLAERLHAARPDLYKDDNHKPEMACALTPFEAMCGFRCVRARVRARRCVRGAVCGARGALAATATTTPASAAAVAAAAATQPPSQRPPRPPPLQRARGDRRQRAARAGAGGARRRRRH